MNYYYLIAGSLTIALGIIHSALGEILIFRHLRNSDIFSDTGNAELKPRHYNTLWSAWHLVTLFGCGLGITLLVLSISHSPVSSVNNISITISVMFIISAIYWLFGTKGKHPAWIVLSAISILTWWAGNT